MNLSLPEESAVSDIIRKVAKIEIMPRFQNLTKVDIREKGPNDLVTIADERAEMALSEELLALLPGSRMLGEEGVDADPSLMARLHEDLPLWIVDPIDGTLNYANGRPVFGTIVALRAGGQQVGGWIYDPVRDIMASALGTGRVTVNAEPATLRPPCAIEQIQGALDYRLATDVSRAELNRRAKRLKHSHMIGSAAQQYLRLLMGEWHFTSSRRTKPWDHAAGVFMVEKLGGKARRMDGSQYDLKDLFPALLVASDETIWQEISNICMEKPLD